MTKKKQDLKILLLQIRQDKQVIQEELESFADHSGLNINQINTYNVFKKPHFGPEILAGFDALFVGGASEASVLEPEKYPFVKSGIELMKYCANNSFPTFASCFGFQMAVLAFGGKITKDTENFEMGTIPISVTDIAKTDPVFVAIQNDFLAVSVHQEKAIVLPDKCQLLAYTKECCHSFRYANQPFWAFQFHPELDRHRLTERLNIYKEKYTEDREHFERIIKNLRETPSSNQLVKNFITHIIS